METQEILKSNKLIAEFMTNQSEGDGESLCYLFAKHPCSYIRGKYTCYVEDLFYHSRYDWLMPVVEKINNLDDFHFLCTIGDCDCTIKWCDFEEIPEDKKPKTWTDINFHDFTLMPAIYNAVVAFIKWYNTWELKEK